MNLLAIFTELSTMGVHIVSPESGRIRLTCSSGNVPAVAVELARPFKSELVAVIERSADLPVCPECGGDQMAIPTFDGYENFECVACDRCSGCRRAGT